MDDAKADARELAARDRRLAPAEARLAAAEAKLLASVAREQQRPRAKSLVEPPP